MLSGENGYLCEKCSAVTDEEDTQSPVSSTNEAEEQKQEETDDAAAVEASISTSSEDVERKDGEVNHSAEDSSTEESIQEAAGDAEDTSHNNNNRNGRTTTQKRRRLRDASKQFSVEVPPEVLVVHLKRFIRSESRSKRKGYMAYSMFNLGGFVKNNARVKVNKTIDLTPFIHPSSPYKSQQNLYDVYAVVEHSGGMSGGHYVAYTRPLELFSDGQWRHSDQYYYISDSSVGLANERDVLDKVQPYILFYQRRGQSGQQQQQQRSPHIEIDDPDAAETRNPPPSSKL